MKRGSLSCLSMVAYTIPLVVSVAAQAQTPPPTPPQTDPSAVATQEPAPAPASTEPAAPPPPAAKPAEPEIPKETDAPGAAVAPKPPSYFTFTEVQWLHGFLYREPPKERDRVTKDILTFQHFSEWAWGRNFFFFDFIKSHRSDGDHNEVYGEWYSTLLASKVFNTNLETSIFRDIGLVMGVNAGAKSSGVGPMVFLPGVAVDFKLPGFAFFQVEVEAYIDRGRFGGSLFAQGCRPATYQVTPSWDLPFAIGGARFDFNGFVDIIGKHGNCEFQVLTQPQLRLDVGNFWGSPNKLYVGTEFQIWVNKYGIKGLTEYNPQTLLVWRL